MRTPLIRLFTSFLLAAGALGACGSDTITEPGVVAEGPALSPSQSTAAERWMMVTRNIVGRREFGSPLGTARTFALVAVAQYDAAVAAGTARVTGKQPSEPAAVSSASAAVLLALYPAEQGAIDAQVAADATYFPAFTSQREADYGAGVVIGRGVASSVMARATRDRTDAVFTGTIPTGAGNWTNSPPAQPVSPRWGEARGWLLSAGNQFRPAAPPEFNSAAFASALAEVRTMTLNRTPEQLTIAQFWQGASGPGGPMGYFTELATGFATAAGMNERGAARVYALLHMAMMDASIACWDAKYTWWYIRPHQADATITTPVGRPNFPAYPSAHSCISSAAAGVLSGLFPSTKAMLDGKVTEAGLARLYAGLHFRFDLTAGQEIGRKVAELALTRIPKANTAIPLD